MPDSRERRLHIVLAEDNPGDVYMVGQALAFHRIEADLTRYKDGEEMLRFIDSVDTGARPCPDVVLLDLNLPRHSGRVLLAQIRSSPVCGHVPIVIVTSSNEESDRKDAYQLGATKYFTKPIDLDDFMTLGALVNELLPRPPQSDE